MSSEDPDAAVTDAITHLQGAEDALEQSSLTTSEGLRRVVAMVRLLVEMERDGDLEEIRAFLTELENYE